MYATLGICHSVWMTVWYVGQWPTEGGGLGGSNPPEIPKF
jgi:hypothetical protein